MPQKYSKKCTDIGERKIITIQKVSYKQSKIKEYTIMSVGASYKTAIVKERRWTAYGRENQTHWFRGVRFGEVRGEM